MQNPPEKYANNFLPLGLVTNWSRGMLNFFVTNASGNLGC